MKSTVLLFALLTFMTCQPIPSDEKILFSSNRNGNSDIFLMNSDGSEVTPLVESSAEEWGATFVDADNIAFMRQVNDGVKRFQLNLQTRKEQSILQPGVCYLDDKNAVFSTQGHYAYSCKSGLFLKKKEESIFRALISQKEPQTNYLAWSFDGTSIIYTQKINGNNDVFSIDIETLQVRNLTNHPANDERGELSPDGKFLVFSSNRHNAKDQDIFILNLETKEAENITNSSGYDLIGRWDLDGKSILYGSNKDENWELYRYTLADKSTIRLTHNDAFDGDPRVR
jgi:Tol biopolymer transport system component